MTWVLQYPDTAAHELELAAPTTRHGYPATQAVGSRGCTAARPARHEHYGKTMIGIPYRLAFAGRDHRNPTLPAYEPKGSPGSYGDAGWTVMHVATDKLIAALTALPRAAWLPGTYRVAEQNGVAW